MIRQKTLLILGAGSGVPYGLPTGAVLRNTILSNLANDSWVNKFLEMPVSANRLSINTFRERLERAQTSSIDSFLASCPEALDLGKALIAYCLLPLESKDRFFNPAVNHHWIHTLMTSLAKYCTSSDKYKLNRLVIITFNYDRVLEYCLTQSIMGHYNVSEEQAFRIAEAIPIIHVHGQLGELSPNGGRNCVPFGYPVNHIVLDIARRNIMVPTDEVNLSLFEEAGELAEGSEYAFFLGFGYDSMNVRNLLSKMDFSKIAQVYGTSHGLGEAQQTRAKQLFPQGKLQLFNGSCNDLLKEKGHSLEY